MATARNERHPVSWEDLRAIITPPKDRQEDDIWRAIDEIVIALQDGRITYEEAKAFIEMVMAANVDYEMREIIANAFSSDERDNVQNTPRRWRFSLVQ